MSSPVDVIWCDFGGVLTAPLDEAADAIETATGISWTDISRAVEKVAERRGLTGLGPLELGLMSQREWGAQVTAELDHAPAVDLREFGTHWYAGRVLETALVDQLDGYRDQGVRVGMLTNSVAEWEPLRDRLLDGVSVFEASLRSHEIGIAKPDPRIFVAADAMLPPRSGALLIDDTPENTVAARAHGWSTIDHVDTAHTIAALRRLTGLVPHRSAEAWPASVVHEE